jgi:hypothetical protein
VGGGVVVGVGVAVSGSLGVAVGVAVGNGGTSGSGVSHAARSSKTNIMLIIRANDLLWFISILLCILG